MSFKHTTKKPGQLKVSPLFNKLIQKKQISQDNQWHVEFLEIVKLQQSNSLYQALKRVLVLYENYPNVVNVQNLTAVLLAQNHQHKEAIDIWNKIEDKDKCVLSNLGRTYQLIGQLDKAKQFLEQALVQDKNYLDGLLNLGVVELKLNNLDCAKKYFERVLVIEPLHQSALFNLGNCHIKMFEYQKGFEYLEKLLQHYPKNVEALTNLVLNQYYTVPYEPERIARLTMKYAAKMTPIYQVSKKAGNPNKPLKIGIVSGDLRDHPVGFFFEGLITYNKHPFTWIAYSNTASISPLTERIRPYFEKWHYIHLYSDAEVIQQIVQDDIDVLIDLSGYTSGNRLSLFMNRLAPIQLSWLGYFGSTGLLTMDGVLADPYSVPEEEASLFSEKIWRLPHTRLCFTSPKLDMEVKPLPALQNGYFTFGCFQNVLKLNHEVLSLWAQIAQRNPSAHWRFQWGKLGGDEQLQFKQQLIALGFNETQLHFYSATSREQYFNAHNEVDLILDTFPYPGGTTTTEALWMGVPTITFAQKGMLARQGEQLLSAAGLHDWVCYSQQEYIEKACDWMKIENLSKLNQLRLSLRDKVIKSPLFDNQKFAEDWGRLIYRIWQEHCKMNG